MVSSTWNLYPLLLACMAAVFAVGAVLMARPAISDRAADRITVCLVALAAVALVLALVVTVFPVGRA